VVADLGYLDRLPPQAEHAAIFEGVFTWRVLSSLPGAEVRWDLPGEGYVSVSVKWHERARHRGNSVADPPRGGTYCKLFPLLVEGEDPAFRAAKEADAIIRELKGG
jgi:hypothetical protein